MDAQTMDVHEVADRLREILAVVAAGTDIVLTDGATPVARITSVETGARRHTSRICIRMRSGPARTSTHRSPTSFGPGANEGALRHTCLHLVGQQVCAAFANGRGTLRRSSEHAPVECCQRVGDSDQDAARSIAASIAVGGSDRKSATTEPHHEILPVTLPHVLALGGLSSHRKDPFDRLLIAQAIAEGAALISNAPGMLTVRG